MGRRSRKEEKKKLFFGRFGGKMNIFMDCNGQQRTLCTMRNIGTNTYMDEGKSIIGHGQKNLERHLHLISVGCVTRCTPADIHAPKQRDRSDSFRTSAGHDRQQHQDLPMVYSTYNNINFLSNCQIDLGQTDTRAHVRPSILKPHLNFSRWVQVGGLFCSSIFPSPLILLDICNLHRLTCAKIEQQDAASVCATWQMAGLKKWATAAAAATTTTTATVEGAKNLRNSFSPQKSFHKLGSATTM